MWDKFCSIMGAIDKRFRELEARLFRIVDQVLTAPFVECYNTARNIVAFLKRRPRRRE